MDPFKGVPGVFSRLAPARPPRVGYRVIPGRVWWRLVHLPWRTYLAARSVAVDAPVPGLARRGPPVYFTDGASLAGCQWPASFAWRVGLSERAQAECQRYGCAVVRFRVPVGTIETPSPALPGVTRGLTVNGAREWVFHGHVPLDPAMQVTYVDVTVLGVRRFAVPL